jgi:lipid A 3-O-deacylase
VSGEARATGWSAVFGLVAIVAAVSPARAIEIGKNDGTQFVIGAGGYDVLHDQTAGIFRGELRLGTNLWLLRPFIGGEVTTDGSVYGYGGFGLDIYLDDAWVLNPNAAVGLWSRGNGKNLGATVEFRTGAEVDYRFSDASRLGVSFHHISNAGIGSHNPGEEEALATYSLPLTFP